MTELTNQSIARRMKVRALLLGDRIDTSGLEHSDVLSTVPLAFRAGQDGVVTVFRYGVVVFFSLSVLEEDEVLRGLRSRIVRAFKLREDETAIIEIAPDKDEQILPGANSGESNHTRAYDGDRRRTR
jgi:uncharacterized Rmd1/YagE family protein